MNKFEKYTIDKSKLNNLILGKFRNILNIFNLCSPSLQISFCNST